MTGRSKRGNGLRNRPGRAQREARYRVKGIAKPEISMLARKGGVKRLATGVFDEALTALREKLQPVIRDYTIMAEEYQDCTDKSEEETPTSSKSSAKKKRKTHKAKAPQSSSKKTATTSKQQVPTSSKKKPISQQSSSSEGEEED